MSRLTARGRTASAKAAQAEAATTAEAGVRDAEVPPAGAVADAGYICSMCGSAWSYQEVRNTGRCRACGGGLRRSDEPAVGGGLRRSDDPVANA